MTSPDQPPAAGAGPASSAPADRAPRKIFGRRKGKALKPRQARLMQTLLPRLVVPGLDGGGVPLSGLFGGERPVWLEIGFGGGEHMAAQAAAHPGIGFIGAEPYLNGIAKALVAIEAGGLDNVRLHPGDARDLMDALPPGAIERIYVLYPDPWPKARHAGRRIINPEPVAQMARVMAPGAELRIATDIAAYAEHAVAVLDAAPGFAPVVAGAPGWFEPWPGWTGTRYEAKARAAGRRPHYLIYRRLGGAAG